MIRISAEKLSLCRNGRPILRDISLTLAAGEMVGIIGPNGAGKTTLLRNLAGIVDPDSGKISCDGIPLSRMRAQDRARMIAYLDQRRDCHWPLFTRSVVAMGRLPHGGGLSAADQAAIDSALGACDIVHLADRPVDRVSGGELARIFLARALAVESQVLLADEPVAELDPAHALSVMDILRARARKGAAVIVVLHDLTMAARYCDRLVLMADGRIGAEGSVADVLTPAHLRRFYGVEAHFAEVAGAPVVVPVGRTAASAPGGAVR